MWTILAACGPLLPPLSPGAAEAPGAQEGGAQDSAAPEDSGALTEAARDWDLAAAQAWLEQRLARGAPSAPALIAGYVGWMDLADSRCPLELAHSSEGVVGAWDQNCSSSTGATFTGRGNLVVDLEEVGGSVVDAAILACAIEDSAGLRFEGGGSFIGNRLEAAAGTYYNEQLEGLALDQSGELLGQRTSLTWSAAWDRVPGAERLRWHGGVGEEGGALVFDELVWEEGACGGLPQGRLELRDPSGRWLELELAGCAACGQLRDGEEDLGELCPGEALAEAAARWQATVEASW